MPRPWKQETPQDTWCRTTAPAGLAPRRSGVLVAVAGRVLLRSPRVRRVLRAAEVIVSAVSLVLLMIHTAPAQLSPPPSPAAVCGNTAILNGPASAPPGAVTIPAGDNSNPLNTGVYGPLPANTTYWFAPGTHTIGLGEFNQIAPSAGDTFLGAPGAVLSGQNSNNYAFTGFASGVTIEYLTIEDFTPPGGQGAVDHNAANNWTMEYNTMTAIIPGTAVYVGTDSTLDWNCLTANGDQGFGVTGCVTCSAVTGGPMNINVDDNEISYNNQCNWEDVPSIDFPITPPAGCTGAGQYIGCGCAGGGKFWQTDGTQFDNNYVLDNYDVGAWWDTDNTSAQAEGNYIAGNYAEGMIFEISYNALVQGNTFTGNLTELGQYGLSPGGNSYGALYISESGSDSRIPGPYGDQFLVDGNRFYNNFGGISLWENPDRFCSGLTGDQLCTLVNENSPIGPGPSPQPPPVSNRPRTARPPAGRVYGMIPGHPVTWAYNDLGPCANPDVISYQPYLGDCRWKTQNVIVKNNLFDFTPSVVGPYCTAANLCGFNGLFSTSADNPYYPGNTTEVNIMFNQGNQFADNTYCGPWMFTAESFGNGVSFPAWQGSPYTQDAGSTLNGPACSPSPPPGLPQSPPRRAVTIPIFAGRR